MIRRILLLFHISFAMCLCGMEQEKDKHAIVQDDTSSGYESGESSSSATFYEPEPHDEGIRAESPISDSISQLRKVISESSSTEIDSHFNRQSELQLLRHRHNYLEKIKPNPIKRLLYKIVQLQEKMSMDADEVHFNNGKLAERLAKIEEQQKKLLKLIALCAEICGSVSKSVDTIFSEGHQKIE